MGNPSKPSWRRSTGPKPQVSSDKGWQSRRVRATESALSGHRVKLLLLGLLVFALAVAFLIAAWRRPLATPLIVASVTKYSAALPPNDFAKEDAARLAEANPKNVHSATPFEGRIDRPSLLEYLERQVAKVPAGGPGKNVAMLYVSAHGALNGGGEPCLLLSDADPLNAASWLKMSELLELLKARPQLKKVLFLDIGRFESLWSAGLLYNGFPEQLEKLLVESPVPNLYVVSAVSAGERAWSAPELGGSVFGYYVARGLQGAAQANDKQITLRELTTYLEREVARHVAEQRASDQRPRLLTALADDQDFAVAYTGGSSLTPSTATQQQDQKQIAARWKQVHEHWRQLEERIRQRPSLEGPSRRPEPVRTAQLQQELLRMEQLLLAGSAYVDEFNSAESRARTLLDEIGKLDTPPDVVAYSLPLHRQLTESNAVDSKAATTLAAWLAADGKPPLKKDEKPPPPLDYSAAAHVAWGFWQQQESLRPIHLRDLLALVDESGGRRNSKGEAVADFVEIHVMRMLDRYVDRAGNSEFTPAQQKAIRSVLATRLLAEGVAAPDDERTHFWNQPSVNEADKSRRLAEDQLFGDPSQPVDPALPADFGEKYMLAGAQGKSVAGALYLRDLIWSELPYLAMWAAQSIDQQDGGVATDQLVEAAEKIADKNLELAATLDSLLAAGKVDDLTTLQPMVDELQQSFQSLRNTFVTYCQELKDRGTDDRVTLREIGEVLQVPSPLLAADERERLASKYVSRVFGLSELLGSPAKKPDAESTGSGKRSSRLSAISKREYHPAIHLLNRNQFKLLTNRREPEPKLTQGNDSAIVWTARQGDRVRSWLRDVEQAASDLEDDTKNRLKDATETQANIRAGASEADRLVRAAAALAPANVRDPSIKLRYVDRHLQLLWHAQRTLDDFWGPPPAKDNAQSYFATVASSYIAGARQFDDTPTSPSYDRKDLREILSDRISAIQGTVIDPRDVRTLGDQPLANQNVHIEWHQHLPVPGMAALFLERNAAGGKFELIPVKDPDSRDWRRQVLSVGSSAQVDVTHRVPIDQLGAPGGKSDLTANLLYRGHLLQKPFSVGRPESVFIAGFDPRTPPRAKVTVKGEGKRRAFITIIIDCSGSMRAIDDGVQRMEAAKGAVLALLNSLELGRHYHIGLRAYAHRYRFDAKLAANGNYAIVDVNGNEIPNDPTANPDKDVQILVRMDELNAQHRQNISAEVNKLRFNGVTPLYYSIMHALIDDEADFQFADEDDLRHIIVITDGINEQQYDRTTKDQLLNVIDNEPRAQGKRVDIVLFQESKVQTDPGLLERHGRQKILSELQDIKQVAQRTKGTYFSANDPDQLIAALRDALKLVKFSVTPVAVPNVGNRDQKELGKDQIIEVVPNQPGQYRVQLHPQSEVPAQIIEIEGGEAIELEYDKTHDQLVFPRYNPGDERGLPGDYLDPESRERYFVTPILPTKSLNRVTFEVAIQNVDPKKFTPRPKNVWAQIEPLSESEQRVGSVYHFYDAQFSLDTPVPVFRFVVNDWPAGASQAAIQMWFKFGNPPIKPNGVLRVTPLEPKLIDEDIPNVQFAAELIQPGQGSRDWRLHVVERHDKGTDLFTARVQATPAAGRVSHSYFIGVDEVRHEFDYSGETSPTAIVTSRDRVIEHSIAVPRFVRAVKEN
jgi:hypothetical protein